MKNTYGKLMYLLQDSTNPDVEDILGFNMIVPIKTVYDVLDEYGVIHVLEDKTVATATQEIIPEGKSRSQVQAEIKRKEHAIEYLSRTYSTSSCPAEVIKQCLYSIGDNHAFLRFNRDPCDKIANCLTKYFTHSEAESEELSLAILSGKDGARLSHSHETQYFYVLQTLTLWKEILHEFYMLWHFSDSDMLSKRNQYRLRDTGQGLNRVQECPLVSRAVHSILHKIQKRSRRWVGSSVIHLGDRNVPNAFMFIDKYSQISSILNPIVRCIEYIDTISKSTKPSGKKSTNPSRANSGSDEQSDENSNSPENDSLDSTQIKKSSSRLRLSNVFSSKITMNPFDLLSSYTNYSMGKKRPSKTTQINLNAIRAYIDYAFGGPTMLKKLILADFFRSAFDGSGADNFFEAGSCIDGRLTSAWNWCSLVEKKSFFPIFLLSGFVGFNGGE
ncbi:UPF0652 protein [Zancudomyces culisetae]|uniref:UPF0652 protein n=1 Tax=Zancudomyces culisetae TaxID=1213189 RepID=A0A1R1PQD3_ZANCU|nr:UPF0652 protein [Zancudomyces culisetae]|eukprot:OMH83159.1 UPF0652 protein [Zancudomyces culisetae]